LEVPARIEHFESPFMALADWSQVRVVEEYSHKQNRRRIVEPGSG